MTAPKSPRPTTNPIALATVKIRLRNSESGRIGSAARRSWRTKATVSTMPAVRSASDVAEPQAIVVPPRLVKRTIPDSATGEERRAEVVDAVLDVLAADVERDRDHREGGRADREVDVEDPAPGEVVDEEAAEQRPDHGRDAEHRAEPALVAPALSGRDEVADDRERRHHQPAAAEPLHRAERDQLAHVLREAAERRADEEDHDRRLQHELAAVEVAELAVERAGDGRREQVGGHDPREVLDAAELADDRRQRGRDDRLVERREQQDEHERAEDQADALRLLDGGRRHPRTLPRARSARRR